MKSSLPNNVGDFFESTSLQIQLNQEKSGEWVEESYFTQELDGDVLGVSVDKKRLWFFGVIMIIALTSLLGRAFYLQIIKGDEYKVLSDENRIRKEVIKTNRGLIKDRNYLPLVENKPYFNVFIIPSNLSDDQQKRTEFLRSMAGLLRMGETDIHQILDSIPERDSQYYRPQLIKSEVYLEQIWPILIAAEQYPAIYVEADSYRHYLLGENNLSLSHILGYEGKISAEEMQMYSEKNYLLTDKIGKSGVELMYDDYLRGQHGLKYWEVDVFLRPQKILYEQDKVIGDDLVLTIDLNWQTQLEKIIKKHLAMNGKRKGGAIVMDPNNGEILAMVSLPSYDNNDFATGISQEKYQSLVNNPDKPFLNRMLAGEYPPGSTFKLVVGAAALQEEVVTSRDTFLSSGGIKIDQWFFPDWQAGGHGITNIYKAISDSVNTYFYMVGGGDKNFKGLGVYRLALYADKFNVGRKLGIDLPGEKGGFIPSPEWKLSTKNEEWYIGDTYHMSIGQGDVLVTPLQVAEYTAFFANGGKLYTPHVLKEIHNDITNVHEVFEQVIIREGIISDNNLEIMRQALRRTVTDGSGRTLQDLGVSVAGKTGTAQWNLEEDPHAWFTCFAPYEKPEIVVTVFVEEGEAGDKISVQIAKEFLSWWEQNYYKK
ncbi:MAG TPA: penicillin-binding protein 2 [bacterium]|nr:penicillin-binding protein 2 [bacterium]